MFPWMPIEVKSSGYKAHVSLDALLKAPLHDTPITETMDRLVLQFLGSSQSMHDISQQLVTIMQDGKIDAREALQLEQILCALDHIMQDIRKLKQTFSAAYTTNTTGVSGSES